FAGGAVHHLESTSTPRKPTLQISFAQTGNELDWPVGDYRQDRFVPLLSHAHLPHARECQASAGTPVRHQPKPRQASGGTLLSCFSRISTRIWCRVDLRLICREATSVDLSHSH